MAAGSLIDIVAVPVALVEIKFKRRLPAHLKSGRSLADEYLGFA